VKKALFEAWERPIAEMAGLGTAFPRPVATLTAACSWLAVSSMRCSVIGRVDRSTSGRRDITGRTDERPVAGSQGERYKLCQKKEFLYYFFA